MTTEMKTPADGQASGPRRRTPLVAALVGLGIVVLLAGIVVWWLSRGDAPEEANLGDAVETVTGDDGATDGDDGAATDDATTDDATTDEATTDDGDAGDEGAGGDEAEAAPAAGIEGAWTIDTSVGEFSFQDSTGTFVGFRVGEELQGIGEIEAVGRTPGVAGTITIEGTTVTAASIEADMAAVTTDDSRRDNRVRGALDVEQFPTATFVLTSPIELGADAAAGNPVSATAAGDLTVHGTTQPVEFALEAQLVDDTVVVVGSTELSFGDFGVTVPSAPIVLSANDFGVVELQLFLIRS